ncbi:MAG TPA: lipase maturation factor family protein [Myxococcales bacterium]|nr:lipase maturation factor family protein [Myxococcales bacterium]
MFWPRWIWLRALGLIFLSAFWSLAFQIRGLNGPRGILPAGDHLDAVRNAVGLLQGIWYAPTLFWLGASDAALMGVTLVGAAASVLLVLNVAPRPSIAIAGVCFLSFVGSAQDFASYQSDGMLLEAAFISFFLAPRGLRPGLGEDDPPSRLAVYLLLWEWFRIYFESGVVKLLSGDEQWKSLTAMDHYYENGPLPSWPGWYVQQCLPHSFHAFTALMTLLLELVVVWLAVLPRRFRIACCCIVTPFQAGIILTANYAFLNYLVLCLGVLLVDDRFLGLRAPEGPFWKRAPWPSRIALGIVFYATLVLMPGLSRALPRPLLWPAIALEPLRIANRYGLFAVMTTERYEIEFQGSNDGKSWTPYPFRDKPQDPLRAPGIFAPYQPRFDWNLWFASLGEWRAYPWVLRVELRLLDGSPQVLQLFAGDPFRGRPPEYVRAVKWQYWFTTRYEKRKTGAWWKREARGLYAPALHIGAEGIEAAPQ